MNSKQLESIHCQYWRSRFNFVKIVNIDTARIIGNIKQKKSSGPDKLITIRLKHTKLTDNTNLPFNKPNFNHFYNHYIKSAIHV